MGKKDDCDKEREFPCNIRSGDFCKEHIKKSVCNGDKKLLKKYRLREGNERKWIERVKVIIEKQPTKPLEQQLAELMPLVRDHRDIKNAFKAKRMTVRRMESKELIKEFLNRLSEMYGREKNKRLNKKIRCHKCTRRGHLRRSCPK